MDSLAELDEDGLVAELTVFMRPLSALTLFNEQMGERLAASAPPPATRLESPTPLGDARVVKGDWL